MFSRAGIIGPSPSLPHLEPEASPRAGRSLARADLLPDPATRPQGENASRRRGRDNDKHAGVMSKVSLRADMGGLTAVARERPDLQIKGS